MSNGYVVDASAILALLNDETGADRVQSVLENATCFMSVVNWSEVARKLISKGQVVEPVAESLQAVGLEFKSFDYSLAVATAQIEAPSLSLGDRACLSLAATLGAIALSADRIWLTFDIGVTVELIR
ncbi:MAG: type II toxin-antitoxin system VapC family toxin [Pleurocapsa sp. SU_5_0]|jgi:PIN domain nuclease of toxin-antitoxin system|nr:type II toxin-antitoxin system VapC family toxin [Pleurocapsa sp. SU_5_0]NJR45460.1 type II toxin-antitoxin system VapC family toxin [Hyellaceae cyanobacterium CSU_1_1]NKB16899.1 type II toxin-antitoxin system VapC family toxin [Pseudanabaena sp. CRU_2_10]